MSLAADAARYAKRLAAHQCGRCATELPDGYQKTTCAGCLAEVSECARKRYWRNRGLVPRARRRPYQAQGLPRKSNADSCRDFYARRRAAGLCVRCPKQSDGLAFCPECRHRRKVCRIMRAERIEGGRVYPQGGGF